MIVDEGVQPLFGGTRIALCQRAGLGLKLVGPIGVSLVVEHHRLRDHPVNPLFLRHVRLGELFLRFAEHSRRDLAEVGGNLFERRRAGPGFELRHDGRIARGIEGRIAGLVAQFPGRSGRLGGRSRDHEKNDDRAQGENQECGCKSRAVLSRRGAGNGHIPTPSAKCWRIVSSSHRSRWGRKNPHGSEERALEPANWAVCRVRAGLHLAAG